MERSREDYYNNYFDLFSHEGWKQLEDDLDTQIEAMKEAALDNDNEKVFHFNRGFYAAIRAVRNLQQFYENSYHAEVEEEGA